MEKKKIQSLQAIRAVAFSAIFLSHLEIISGLGGWGVSVFFVLSGFLMSYSYEGRAKVLNGRFIDRIKFAYSKVKKIVFITYYGDDYCCPNKFSENTSWNN
jgi:peptidoglycan/LPS O-acetylase OafA/YrhL